jgi:hypothetical protein
MSDETIWIITADDNPITPVDNDARGGNVYSNPWEKTAPTSNQGSQVSAQKLEGELSKFLRIIGRVFNHVEVEVKEQTGFKLDEIELTVEITAEGEIKLLGTGVKTSSKGRLTFKFKRGEAV